MPTDYQFTGQKNDGGTGLYYYGARYYDPVTGRFVSADTVVPSPGKPQALNRYSYVYNNPMRFVDPTGMFTEEEMLGWGITQEQIDNWKQNDKPWWAIMQAGQLGDMVTGQNPYTSVGQSRPTAGVFGLWAEANRSWTLRLSGRTTGEFAAHTRDQNLLRSDANGGPGGWRLIQTPKQFMSAGASESIRGRDPGLYFDADLVNWEDVAWDGVGTAASVFGTKVATRAFRYSNAARQNASTVSRWTSLRGAADSFVVDQDRVATILSSGGLLAPPFGPIFSLGSFVWDLKAGVSVVTR